MRPGEQIFSRRPLHSLEASAAAFRKEGVVFRFEPAPGGYWCFCDSIDKGPKE